LTARIAKCLNVGIQAIKAELTIIKKVPAMSPNGVGHVLGLNNKPGHDAL
jgi:hypothetical protein